ncbi:MFS transporter [Psychromarinibacter sp. C21-152]|uniref:MFS transporter n=1 Tax=Psychromarinibacter sediminicola TaxID=3033385 RepID=A0AAE3NKV4_9RHOB|nr:MFS transporter [Psychromarinibacter sediminicola]MDF0599778.1 MFS transporter [Psychromarinibacter sediminicola]
MSVISALRLSRAPAAGLMAVGVLWGSFAALVPDIKARVGVSDAELGVALLMSALGGLISLWAAPWITARLGRRALPVLGALVVVAILLPVLPQRVWTLGLALFGMGVAVALLDIASNVRISALEARHGRHLMNVNHAMFSFAFAGAAWICGMARQAGGGPAQILPAMALVVAALILAMRAPRGAGAGAAPVATEPAGRAPWGAIALTGLVMFCSFIGENATEAWSALHIERTLGAEAGHGSFGPATLGLVMGIGRMSGQLLTARFGDARLIFGSALLGIVGALTLAAAPTVPVAIAGVAITGLGMAVIVPSANSILGARVTEAQRSHAISRAWMFGVVGFFVGPSMMGGIAELFGLRMSFVAVAVIVALIVPAIWALSGRRRAQVAARQP